MPLNNAPEIFGPLPENIYPAEPLVTVPVYKVYYGHNVDRKYYNKEKAEAYLAEVAAECAERSEMYKNRNNKDMAKFLREKIKDYRIEEEVAGYANYRMYTDVEPYEIVKVVSGVTLEIRPMKATRHPGFRPNTVVGGFAGHTTNNYDQKYIYERDPEAPVMRIRMKKNGRDFVKGNLKFDISARPCYFYDYNF